MEVSTFQSSNWKSMNTTQRVAALQCVEDNMAKQQRRQSRIVKSEKMGGNTNGYYSMKDPQYLKVNIDLVASDYGNYQAMQTTIHEGRHAYQDDCIHGRINPDSQNVGKVESWRQNSVAMGGVYNSPNDSYVDYKYQPKEADANKYAKDQVDSAESQLSSDPGYYEFRAKRDTEDYFTEDVAKSTYGDNYEQVIQQDIERRYQLKAQQEGQGKLALNKPDDRKEKFDFKKDREQRRQAPQQISRQSNPDKFRPTPKENTQAQQISAVKAQTQC